MSQVVMSALSSHLGEKVTLDLNMGLSRRKNHGPCSLGSPYVIEIYPEPQALGSKQYKWAADPSVNSGYKSGEESIRKGFLVEGSFK